MIVRIVALLVLFFFAAYKLNDFIKSDKFKNINEQSKIITKLKNADLIFVNDKNYKSDKSFSLKNNGYTNAGICVLVKDKTYIFFIQNFGGKSILKAQEVYEFIKDSKKIAVYEYNQTTSTNDLLNELNLFRNNNNKIYNTSFINEIFFKLYKQNLYTRKLTIENEDIITVEEIIKNTNFTKRYEINF